MGARDNRAAGLSGSSLAHRTRRAGGFKICTTVRSIAHRTPRIVNPVLKRSQEAIDREYSPPGMFEDGSDDKRDDKYYWFWYSHGVELSNSTSLHAYQYDIIIYTVYSFPAFPLLCSDPSPSQSTTTLFTTTRTSLTSGLLFSLSSPLTTPTKRHVFSCGESP